MMTTPGRGGHDQRATRRRFVLRLVGVVMLGLLTSLSGTANAGAHGGEAEGSASELVLQALAVLEVHPAPAAAVTDKLQEALDASDQQGVRRERLVAAGQALERGDIRGTKEQLEAAVGECPDADILYVSRQPARPPCTVASSALVHPRRAIGGTAEVVILVIAAGLALAGVAIVRHRYVSGPRRDEAAQ